MDYQLGVFISRSSVNVFKINKLWTLPVLQVQRERETERERQRERDRDRERENLFIRTNTLNQRNLPVETLRSV